MYLMETENIKPSLFLRYPLQIAGPTYVEITNRYAIDDNRIYTSNAL